MKMILALELAGAGVAGYLLIRFASGLGREQCDRDFVDASE
jgi:hypothetical protein